MHGCMGWELKAIFKTLHSLWFIFHNMQIPKGFQQFLEKCGDFKKFITLSPFLVEFETS